MCVLGALYHVYRDLFFSSTSTCDVYCVELPLLPLCFAASITCARTVVASTRGPRTVIIFRHLFVKVNYAYVRFIAKLLPTFGASTKLADCTLDGKQCLYSGVW